MLEGALIKYGLDFERIAEQVGSLSRKQICAKVEQIRNGKFQKVSQAVKDICRERHRTTWTQEEDRKFRDAILKFAGD